jgi:hypothetical protein
MIQLPQPDFYQELDPATCPAGHPPEISTLRVCTQCETARQRSGVWPPYCHVCHTERMYASWKRMEQDGQICPVCLPMCVDRLGQIRPAAKLSQEERSSSDGLAG